MHFQRAQRGLTALKRRAHGVLEALVKGCVLGRQVNGTVEQPFGQPFLQAGDELLVQVVHQVLGALVGDFLRYIQRLAGGVGLAGAFIGGLGQGQTLGVAVAGVRAKRLGVRGARRARGSGARSARC